MDYIYLNKELTLRVGDAGLEMRVGETWYRLEVLPPNDENESPTVKLTQL